MEYPDNQFWKIFKTTEGALSCCEAIAIYNIALSAPKGTNIELGTYQGKSAISAWVGLKGGTFHLVDPIFSEKEKKDKIVQIIDWFGILSEIHADYSLNIIEKYAPYSYAFVDSGSHGDGLPIAEVKLLEHRVIPNGIIAFHDFRSQFIEVEQAYNYLLSTGKYEEIPINWEEIKAYVKEHNLEQGNNSWHHPELEFPCFVGALRRK